MTCDLENQSFQWMDKYVIRPDDVNIFLSNLVNSYVANDKRIIEVTYLPIFESAMGGDDLPPPPPPHHSHSDFNLFLHVLFLTICTWFKVLCRGSQWPSRGRGRGGGMATIMRSRFQEQSLKVT